MSRRQLVASVMRARFVLNSSPVKATHMNAIRMLAGLVDTHIRHTTTNASSPRSAIGIVVRQCDIATLDARPLGSPDKLLKTLENTRLVVVLADVQTRR